MLDDDEDDDGNLGRRWSHGPLPRPDDVFANMADGMYFTSLGLKDVDPSLRKSGTLYS